MNIFSQSIKRSLLQKVTIKIECSDNLGNNTQGSGVLIKHNDKYYVLTAKHCIQHNNVFYDKEDINIYRPKNHDKINLKVININVNNDSKIDCAVIEVEDSENKITYDINVIILTEDNGDKCTLSAFPKGEFDTYRFRCVNDNEYQYIGNDAANNPKPLEVWKGSSGGGLFVSDDKNLYLVAFMEEIEEAQIVNNKFRCPSSTHFLDILPNLPHTNIDTVSKKIEDNKKNSYFRPVESSLLIDKEMTRYEFIESKKLRDIIKQLQDEDIQTILLTALSGLGKTRLLYEAFKTNSNNRNCFYLKYFDKSEGVAYEVISLLNRYKNDIGVIIIDDCPINLLNEIIKHRNNYNDQFRIIATNNDFFEIKDSSDYTLIKLESSEIINDVNNYIDKTTSAKDEKAEDSIRKIKKISDGFPQMANELIAAYNTSNNIGVDIVNELMPKILKLDGLHKEEELKMMRVLSLCQPTPYDNEKSQAYNYLITNKNFNQLYDVSEEQIKDICQKLIKRFSPTLIEISSSWLNVRPFPLAVYLTKEWLENCRTERFKDLICDLNKQSNNIKSVICDGFCKHIEQMRGNKYAITLISDLMGSNEYTTFYTDEILKSETGSTFLYSMAIVNPKAIADCIYRILINKSYIWIEQNIKGEVLRNITLTLERLSFVKESYSNAVLSLLKLSIISNDINSNSALNQLAHLFQIYLAGTEVNLQERLETLKYISQIDEKCKKIAIYCADRALGNHNLNRFGDIENFVTERLKDYTPSSYREILDYWEGISNILMDILGSNNIYADDISIIVEKYISSWFRMNIISIFNELINKLIDIKKFKWENLYFHLWGIKQKSDEFIPNKEKTCLNIWLEQLQPTYFLYELKLAVYKFRQIKGENYEDAYNKVFSPLSEMFIKEQIYSKTEEIDLLLDKYDYTYFHFIKNLNKQLTQEQLSALLAICVDLLKHKDEEYESLFLIHLLHVYRNNVLYESFLSKVLEQKKYMLYTKIRAYFDNDLKQFDILYTKTSNKEFNFDFIRIYLYDYSISDEGAILFIQKLRKYYPERSMDIINYIIVHQYDVNVIKDNRVSIIVKEIALEYNSSENNYDEFNKYEKFLEIILDKTDDKIFAKQINKKLTIIYNSETTPTTFNDIYITLLRKYHDVILDDFLKVFISKDHSNFFFNVRLDINKIMFDIPNIEDKIKDLCIKNPVEAPIRFAEIIPCFKYSNTKEGKVVSFSDLFIWLIENFGDDKLILSSLHANLGSFSWEGSVIPYHKRNIFCFTELIKNHKLSSNTKKWVEDCIKHEESQIKYEQNNDDYERLHYS